MTLDGMNAWLADKGFAVTRERDSIRNLYVFTICKGDCFTRGEFEYPHETSYSRRHDKMVKFMESLVDKFFRDHIKFKEENNMNPYNPCYTLVDNTGKRIPVVIETLTQKPGEYESFTGHVVGDESLERHRVSYRSYSDIFRDYAERDRKSVIPSYSLPYIKNVIHNDPATIVFWADGTKTVVKCQPDDIYDPEKGLAMAISKKALGNQGNYCNVFKKWLPEETEPHSIIANMPLDILCRELYKLGIKVEVDFAPKEEPIVEQDNRWKIWFKEFDSDGNVIGGGQYCRDYASKSSATRRAKKLFSTGDWQEVHWIVSQTNPWAADA